MTDVNYLKDVKGIPDFWFKAMKNSQMIFELVKEKDEDILKNLRLIESSRTSKPKTLKISFHFNSNDYFDNETLDLTVNYKNDSDEVEKVVATEINWKENKDVTKKKIKKK